MGFYPAFVTCSLVQELMDQIFNEKLSCQNGLANERSSTVINRTFILCSESEKAQIVLREYLRSSTSILAQNRPFEFIFSRSYLLEICIALKYRIVLEHSLN
jgi:hypothetical protein